MSEEGAAWLDTGQPTYIWPMAFDVTKWEKNGAIKFPLLKI